MRRLILSPTRRPAWLLGALATWTASAATAQGLGVALTYGRWWHPDAADVYTGGLQHSLFGPFDYGLGVTHLDDSRAADNRTQTGGELSLGIGRDGAGLYLVGAALLAVRHRDRDWDAHWSAGAGYAIRPVPFLSLGIEARYQVEDGNVRGFWQLDPTDRRGLLLQGRLALGAGPRRAGGGRGGGFRAPSEARILAAARRAGASEEAAKLAARIVATALDAMGTPYKWGGSDADGYDCSGLIRYAYAEYGIILPRVSRDQARMGTLVDKDLEALRPGDILGFAVQGTGISHVGLYVGDGMLIHSSSRGVRLSSLAGGDPDGRWWRARWMVARRIVN